MADVGLSPAKHRRWPVLIGLVLAVAAALIGGTVLILGASARTVVSFHNGRAQATTLMVDGKDMGRLAPGATLTRHIAAGVHHVSERTGPGTVADGDFAVPEPKDPLLGYQAVYLLGDGARLATVELCYGKCPFQGPNVVPFTPPSRYFAMPNTVAAGTVLDEAFLSVSIADPNGSKIQTHLCSLAPDGQPHCPLPK